MKMNYKTYCQKENLREIRRFLSDRLSQLNISPIEKHQVILATDEACANAIIHGNNCDKSRELSVDLEITEFDITIEIYDIGSYRPNERITETRDIRQNIRAKQKGGLGLRLMHHIMDKVRYYSRGNTNICSMTKHLSKTEN